MLLPPDDRLLEQVRPPAGVGFKLIIDQEWYATHATVSSHEGRGGAGTVSWQHGVSSHRGIHFGLFIPHQEVALFTELEVELIPRDLKPATIIIDASTVVSGDTRNGAGT